MSIPKYLQNKTTTRSRSKRQETKIAKDLKGRTTINSGATFGENDILTDWCEVEAKTTAKKSYTLKLDDIIKMRLKSKSNKMSVMQVTFEGGGFDAKKSDVELVVLDYFDFLYLVNKVNKSENE